jgi:predicted NBD/HSP70 family sugar kinase
MYLVFDIGGTHLRMGVSGDGGELDKVEVLHTPQGFEEAMELIKVTAEKLTGGEKVEAAAGGVAGALHKTKTFLEGARNLPEWIEQPLKERLQKIIGAPVFLENDAAMGGLGEAVYGAGKGGEIVAFLTVGTGVGGSRITGGKIDQNALGFEPGKQIISLSPMATLEDLISGKAIEKEYKKKPEEIVDDPDYWDGIAKKLAVGLNNIAIFWSPSVIVLGGSVVKSLNFESIERYFKEILTVFTDLPKLKVASLDDLSGLYGSLSYLKQKAS